MARTGVGSDADVAVAVATPSLGGHRRSLRWAIPMVAVGLTFSACGLHVSKHGVSGSVFGHSFSASDGQLPAGFPSGVPVPDSSRVLGGVGGDNKWDVGFAVTGAIAPGTAAYQAKFQSAGYTLSNIQSGSTPETGASGSPSTTITLSGSLFTAKNAQWTVQVESGSTSSVSTGVIKAGEFAINITVVPTTSSPTST